MFYCGKKTFPVVLSTSVILVMFTTAIVLLRQYGSSLGLMPGLQFSIAMKCEDQFPLTEKTMLDSVPMDYSIEGKVKMETKEYISPYNGKNLNYRVWGPDLNTAMVAVPSEFYIQVLDEAGSNATLEFETRPGDFHADLIVRFAGPALFAARSVRQMGKGLFVVNYTAWDTGHYLIYVELFTEPQDRSKRPHYTGIGSSPYNLRVHDTSNSSAAKIFYNPNVCADGRSRPGRWVRCVDIPEKCVRTGWIWLPLSCHFRIFSVTDLKAAAAVKPVWIVFAGTSVQRGTFFSTVDLLLEGKATNLTRSSFWKCWGWMDLVVGNVRLSYLDLRLNNMWSYKEGEIEHDYLLHAQMAVEHMRRDGRGPDVFFLEVVGKLDPSRFDRLWTIRSWLGLDWDGMFLLSAQKPSLIYSSLYLWMDNDGPGQRKWEGWVWDWIKKAQGKAEEIRGLATHEFSMPFIHAMETPLREDLTLHYHRQCSEGGNIHVCGPVTDMEGQMVLNFALRHARARTWTNKRTRDLDSCRFCMQCPDKLRPLTCRDIQVGKCFSYIPEDV